MSVGATIVWYRNDLRLADHPPLAAAITAGGPVVPVFIWSPEIEGAWAPGGADKWWLHQSLTSLSHDLRERGSRLLVKTGDPLKALLDLARLVKADAVYWSERCDQAGRARDDKIRSELERKGIKARTFNSNLLFAPEKIMNKQGNPYTVFTPYWKACLASGEPEPPRPLPRQIPAPEMWPPESARLEQLGLEPRVNWVGEIRETWRPGAKGGWRMLERFLDEALPQYAEDRDRPDRHGTSRLSPYLHHGEISPREIWHAVRQREETGAQAGLTRGGEAYLRQLVWREFAHYLLYHFPHTVTEPLHGEFAEFPWEADHDRLIAWQRGFTGYPLVDAGMRELWTTGWMHNRVRMIVASFLVKDLMIHWHEGSRWFWETLVDADMANNTFGWQWVAGCGADAAPFFRVFNPVLQGKKFDPEGNYIRQWVPELAEMPNQWIHLPWLAPAGVLDKAGVQLDKTYPRPIVDHDKARDRALLAYDRLRGKARAGR